MQWKIYQVRERESTSIPIDQLMHDGDLDIFDDVLSHNYFAISLKKDRLAISAGNFIGLIPLNSRIALLVEPKAGRNNWLHIVGTARAYLRELNYLVDYSRVDKSSQSLLEFLSRALITQMKPIDEFGLWLEYHPHLEATGFPKGKLLIGDSLRNIWSRGNSREVSVSVYKLTKDTPHNRLLKYSLTLVSRYLRDLSLSQFDSASRALLTRLEDLLATVPIDHSLKFMNDVVESLDRNSIPGIRNYYGNICRTGTLIIEQTGLIPHQEGSDRTYSFVFNMEEVFQRYCYRLLHEGLGQVVSRPIIVLQEPHGSIPLFEDNPKRDACPDIIIQDGSENLIIEVKYKPDPDRNDINQTITYAVAYKTSRAVILCFTNDSSSKGWQRLGIVGQQIELWVYRIYIDSGDILSEESDFLIEIHQMLLKKVHI